MITAEPQRRALHRLRIAPMRQRHLQQVLGIERRAYPRPWSPGLFLAELARPETRSYLVALADPRGVPELYPSRARRATAAAACALGRHRVVGYAGVMVEAGEAHITTVAAEPRLHRRKVASHLLVELLTGARSMGAEHATLEVRLANRGAQRLYAAFGFVPAGVRPGYYRETGEDALVMWLHDLQEAEAAERIASQRARLAEPGGASGGEDLPVPWVRGRVGLSDSGEDTAGAPGSQRPEEREGT